MLKAITSTILFIFSCHLSADTYTVAVGEWPPFTDMNREDGGISIQILRSAMATQQHEIELVPMPWARAMAMLEKGEVDILPAVWYREERTKTMLFSDQYSANRLVFIKVKGDDYEFTGLPSLYDKVVGVVKDYAYDGNIVNDKNIHFSEAYSLESNVKKVISGRIDVTLDDEIAIKEMVGPELLAQVETTKNALNEVPLYIVCRKNSKKCPGIIRDFNRGLKLINEK